MAYYDTSVKSETITSALPELSELFTLIEPPLGIEVTPPCMSSIELPIVKGGQF